MDANLVEVMNGLKRKLEELNACKEDTMSRVTTDLHPRKKLKKEVELWLREVERINGEILDLEQEVGERNFVPRESLAGNVLRKKEEVEELLEQGKFHDGLVVDNSGWIGQAVSTKTVFGGAAKMCMEEIWAYLMDDGIGKIGVWGMGGVGKTTIMKLIHNQLLKETEKFDIVIWVTVSKEVNISRIQNNIAQAMDVELNHVEDETGRAGMIYETLVRKGKYVLILDDLWEKLSLEEVGIPEPSKGSKLLVTNRFLDVCYFLDCREVKVPTLSESDAWSLFLEKVGQDILNHADLLPIVKSVAKECGGLPLAIVTIASCMRGLRNTYVWRNALLELKTNVKSVNLMEETIFQQLQFSYDRLGDEKVKHCFLCCALYPEDFEIDTDELIKLWIAEGLVEEMDSMQMEIDKGRIILNKLRNSCLIENCASGSNWHDIVRDMTIEYREDRVKLHDVVRDLALRIASVRPRFLVRAGMQLKEIPDVQHWHENLDKASFMENWQLQIPPQMPPPKCPNLSTLSLSGCYTESIPECFFEQMQGLKILDLSYNSVIESLPNSISNLENLTTLLLGWCLLLKKVPSFSKLQALKKLDLVDTNIRDIPHGMERLVNLRYLDLNKTRITKMADGILAKFTSLQHLAVDSGISLRGEEIGRLRKLEIFQGSFDDLKEWNSYVQALHGRIQPRQYGISVGERLECVAEKAIIIKSCNIGKEDIKILSDVEKLEIDSCTIDLCEEEPFFSWFVLVPPNIFSSLSRIEIFNCKNIKKLFSSDWVLHNLQNLEYLGVEECEEMEEIIASDDELEVEDGTSASFKYILPKLCWLRLWGLPELKSICGANGVMVCDSIQHIEIRSCPELKRIPLNLPLQDDDGQPSAPPSLTTIAISSKEWWESLEWDHPNAKSLLEPYIDDGTLAELAFLLDRKSARKEDKSRLRKLEFLECSFDDLNELNSCAQGLNAHQYCIYVGDQPAVKNASNYRPEKFIGLNGCNICTFGIKILSDVKELVIVDCVVDLCVDVAFFSGFIPVRNSIFSSLSRIEIVHCQNIKKLFLSNWMLQNLQKLVTLCVRGCKEMEEIVASETELEEERTDTMKITLPKLCWLELLDLPELRSICSASGVIVCDSIQKIFIGNCPKLRRIPLSLPLRRDGRPSPPPFLKTINAYPEEWWEVVEWDYPNAKSLLQPYIEN